MIATNKQSLVKLQKHSEFVKYISGLGFAKTRQCGSHGIWRNQSGVTLSVPETREIAVGTLRNLVKLLP